MGAVAAASRKRAVCRHRVRATARVGVARERVEGPGGARRAREAEGDRRRSDRSDAGQRRAASAPRGACGHRDAAGRETLGGGRVLDPFPPSRHRRRPDRLALLAVLERPDPAERLAGLVASAPLVSLSITTVGAFAGSSPVSGSSRAAGSYAQWFASSARVLLYAHTQRGKSLLDHVRNRRTAPVGATAPATRG